MGVSPRYRNLAEARASIARFIEKVYDEKRFRSALGYRPPMEFEQTLLVSSGAREGAPQVAIWILVAAAKMRAGELQDRLVWVGLAPRRHVLGDPQIHADPVGLRKALRGPIIARRSI